MCEIKNWIIIFAVLFLSACNPADVSIHLNSQLIKSQLLDKCGDDENCKSAVESQFHDCFNNSGYAKLKEFGSHTFDGEEGGAIIEEAIRNTCACIVDENGDPYFSFENVKTTDENN